MAPRPLLVCLMLAALLVRSSLRGLEMGGLSGDRLHLVRAVAWIPNVRDLSKEIEYDNICLGFYVII